MCHLDSGQQMKQVKAPRGGSSPRCTECCWLWLANSPIHVSAGLWALSCACSAALSIPRMVAALGPRTL